MPKGIPSIEDLLIPPEEQPGEDETAQKKLATKQHDIQKKDIERLTKQQADDAGIPYISLVGFPISPEALSQLSEEDSARLKAVCFFYDGTDLRLGTTDPDNEGVKQIFSELIKKHFVKGNIYLISDNSLRYGLELYKKLPKVREIIRGVRIDEEELSKFSDQFSSFNDLQTQVDQAQVTDVVTIMLASAVKTGASDVHIEAEEKAIKVRFRIDGVLHDVVDLGKDTWKKIIARLKLLTQVKINVDNKPQDGRMSIYLKDDRIDIRASFLPTAFGESVVMRILHSKSVGLAFEELGIRAQAFEQLKQEIERPNGMIITTGPTGSGKTTTLYAILKKLNQEDTKIITIEDPIEYQLKGVNQSQTSEKYTFAHGLRSIVRQDPDVIMVGEIRDLETAEIAIQAALTGHLVLSTIHTNDAAGTVPRLLSMGAKPFLIAPAINAMIGQRLVRKICTECQEEASPDQAALDKVKKIIDGLPAAEKEKIDTAKMKFFRGRGCDACQQIGYKGRIGVYEIMVMNAEVEKLILSGKVSEYDMRENAAKNGMISMVQDGVLKALEGITSLEEVFRVAE
jgi:type IV pilus assembly protein PilB